MKISLSWLLGISLLLGGAGLWAQQDPSPTPSADQSTTTAPDNTGVNKRDRNANEATADKQKENKEDRELARQIRKSLMRDKSFSTYAHNIKIIAQDGMVTLKGPVKSEEEKQSIEAKAAEVAGGADKVISQIEVAAK
jgi:hyperosmotically inducible periplasmic protein